MYNIRGKILVDGSVTRLQYHKYKPFGQPAFAPNDYISLVILSENTYLLPSVSRLCIERRLLNAEGQGKSSDTELTKNCALYLFSDIQYRLNNQIIDHVRNPGIATLMKGYVSFTACEANALQNAGWGTIDDLKKLVDGDGRFNFCIPLKMILGFAEDYKKNTLNSVINWS
ncbi:uncharacterized protein LOC126425250 [Schistocerca serialis cubense]|uniref:uncharacterized protein LOC126425250 n=1 Tax=Schistocerca serialis cubense TaxID=2023355 RepID=UPI00214E68F2|nr:uncharacterized protein LOC126425250 [Schistocerca serialis cubense]